MTPPAPRTASVTEAPAADSDLLTDIDDEVDSDVVGTLRRPPVPRTDGDPVAADPDSPPAGPQAGSADGLTDRERQILAFERQWWKHAGAKEQAIRDLFEVSSTRYYQLVNALLDNPGALAYDPVLVRRLRRLRATRSRARSAGRTG